MDCKLGYCQNCNYETTISITKYIINDDQSEYLKGRYIEQSIRILEDVSFFTKQNQLPGILLSIDFEAFDSLNWNFLYKTLKHLYFGDNFIGYVKDMYNNRVHHFK